MYETKKIFSENGYESGQNACASTSFFDVPNSTWVTKTSKTRQKTSRLDVFVLVIESLGLENFLDQMPLTRTALEESSRLTWFTNLHARRGGTRENLPPLLFGQPLNHFNLVLDVKNYSSCFDLSKNSLEKYALWRIARRAGYETLYGSTACNMLFGLNHISTKDGYVWHDTSSRRVDFMHSFPFGAYYTNSSDCQEFRQVSTADEVFRCSSGGPYHHKFFEYYKTFSSSHSQSPLFTVVHLLEPHGNLKYWPLDFHTAKFLHWLLKKQDTFVLFLGDHGDSLGTPAGVSIPRVFENVDEVLKHASESMLLHENFYQLFTSYFKSKNLMRAVRVFRNTVVLNTCEKNSDIAACYCEPRGLQRRSTLLTDDVINRAVEHILAQSKGSKRCASLKFERSQQVDAPKSDAAVHLIFTVGIATKVVFSVEVYMKTLDIKQLTRYSSQIPCTPSGYSPQYCFCDVSAFASHNEKFRVMNHKHGFLYSEMRSEP